MKTQNYSNHVQYYPAHHFVFYPVPLAVLGASIYCVFHFPFQQILFGFITAILLFILWLSFMLRQHYALGNQNRIVRLEMRVRYFQLTGKRFDTGIEQQLSFGQIAALRFAPDDELTALVQRTLNGHLQPADIKKAIVNWQGDYMRV